MHETCSCSVHGSLPAQYSKNLCVVSHKSINLFFLLAMEAGKADSTMVNTSGQSLQIPIALEKIVVKVRGHRHASFCSNVHDLVYF